MGEQSYDPIVPGKVGNRRALERGGHGTHRREGGNKRTHLPKGDITGTQNSDHYVHRHRQNSRTCQGGSATTILLDRSPNHSRKTACGIPGSKKRSQCRDRRRHVQGVRKGRRREYPQAASAAQGRQVSVPATPPSVYPQGKREAKAYLDSRPRGQARAKGSGGTAERHLRAGFSRLLLRVSTRSRATPSAGRSGESAMHSTHGVDPGDRHRHIL